MNKVGLNYGPAFQGLTGITSDTVPDQAVASLPDQDASSESTYQLHPTTIDLCLQMFTVAAAKGATRRLTNLCVPTSIEEIYVRRADCNLQTSIVATASAKGSITGDAIVMAAGEVALHMKQGRFSPLEGQTPTSGFDGIAGAQLQWKPDIDFISADKMMRPRVDYRNEICRLERLALLCIFETDHLISSSPTDIKHLKRFQEWMNIQMRRAAGLDYRLVPNTAEIAALSSDDRLKAIEDAAKAVANSEGKGIAEVLLRVVEHAASIFVGNIDPIAVLMEDHGLTSIYQFYADMWDCRDFFGLLGHAKPNLRVLEIGAGTGGTTAGVLSDLISPSGVRMYSEYAYTDVSAGFFVAAKEKFKDYRNIQYAVLDITKDPIEQGFEEGSYDLILASNVVHATPNIAASLRNVRKLLHPQGRLFLQELSPGM
ncbi:MAG: putative secondary metabolism biosynthetic enzyme [Ramalina farinacea]|uniref:Secondary metabolism biosynthetic enzyme n=1 Tax=Ramalina farinacea TaxID=258253 RepID=A0AA43TYV5_9LECA|nr:putative secondary metabolism biosynthetic enzyme [Ramalina farinacea]